MASFAVDLPVQDRGESIVPTAVEGPNPLAAFASGVEGIGSAFGRQQANARANQKFSDEQSDRHAENALANYDLQQPVTLPPGGQQLIDGAVSVQKSADNGYTSQAAAAINLHSALGTIAAKYPASAGHLLAYAKEQGLQDPVIQQAGVQAELDKTEALARQAMDDNWMKTALSNGHTGDRASLIYQGQLDEASDRNLRIQLDNLNIAKGNAELGKLKDDSANNAYSVASQNATTAITDRFERATSAFTQRALGYVLGATDPTEIDSFQKDFMPTWSTSVEAFRASALGLASSQGVNAAGVKQINDYFDTKRAMFVNIFADNVKANADALQNVASRAGLSVDDAMPVYSFLKTALGPAGAMAAATSQWAGFPKDLQAQLSVELKQVSTDLKNNDQPSLKQDLRNYQEIVAGRGSVAVLPVEQAIKQVSLAAGQIGVNASSVLGDDPAARDRFLGNVNTIAYGARSIAPGTQNIHSMQAASEALFAPAALNALVHLGRNPENATVASDAIVGVRSSAAHMLDATSKITATDPNGILSIQFKKDGSGFEIVANRDAYNKYVASERSHVATAASPYGVVSVPGVPPMSFNQAVASAPEDMKTKVALMNQSLDALSAPGLFVLDPTVKTKGVVTQLDLKRHYVLHTPLPGGAVENPAAPVSKLDRQTEEQAIIAEGKTLPGRIQNDPSFAPAKLGNQGIVDDAARAHKVPGPVAAELIGSESAFDNSADAHVHFPDSHAYGLGQLQPETARRYGLKIEGGGIHEGKFDDRTDPNKNADASMHYFSDIAYRLSGGNPPSPQQWVAAAKEYKGGSISTKDASAILRAAGG